MKIMHNLVATLGVILLIPIIIAVNSYISFMVDIFELFSLSQSDPNNIAGTISAQIVHQIQVLIVSVPGLIAVSICIFKFKFNPKWYSLLLKVYGVLSICMLPILFFAGVYIFFLSKKYRNIT